MSGSPDLEHSLSPVYTRGLLRAGQSAFAVLGVGADEPQAVGRCRAQLRHSVDGLPAATAGRARPRRRAEAVSATGPVGDCSPADANLNADAAKWQLYELDERSEICEPIDAADSGNIITRLTRAVDVPAAEHASPLRSLAFGPWLPAAEITIDSAGEIVFRLYGLEFARACLTPMAGSFRNREAILFGVGPAEYVLDEISEALFGELVKRITEQRQPGGSHTNLFFRLAPERWLESLITRDVRAIDERLDGRFVYSQVPAFTACDRAMLDVLTCTLDGRLAVLELKADEDIHLPLQGLDYWARVRWHQQHGEFTRNGYFAGRELSSAPPLLLPGCAGAARASHHRRAVALCLAADRMDPGAS